MLRRWQHIAGIALAIGGGSFAASFGGRATTIAAYAIAIAIGVVVYVQGDRSATAATVTGNLMLGYLGGAILSLSVATGLFVWFLNLPVDFAAWQMGLRLWGSWMGLGAAVLSGFFLTGFSALLS